MATLVLSTVGTALGGPIGGAIGALIGQSFDEQLLAPASRGPRLGDLGVQSSSYGTEIPRIYGSMRVAGSVVWATDLVESEQTTGAKGQPDVTYSYSVSLAVALSSRPVGSIGRIWADGKLLRGAEGDFKVPTTFRFYEGTESQEIDPLIGSIEGIANTPAYRGIALAVFENLELAAFGNRIPFMTFEAIADAAAPVISLIMADASAGAIASDVSDTVAGYAAYGRSIAAAVQPLVDCFDVRVFDDGSVLRPPLDATPVPIAPEELGSSADGQKAARVQREQLPVRAVPSTLRLTYYDPQRDYQTGETRAVASEQDGNDVQQELPAVLSADDAKSLVQQMLARQWASRDRLTLRLPPGRLGMEPGAFLEPGVMPASWIVDQSKIDGFVTVVELRPSWRPDVALAAEPGRIVANRDAVEVPMTLALIEAPNLNELQAAAPSVLVAASAPMAGWTTRPVTVSSSGHSYMTNTARRKSVLGRALTTLANADPYLVDEISFVDVELIDQEQWLTSCDDEALGEGVNLAALGSEFVQFGDVVPLEEGTFRLSRLLRGRGGTEWAAGMHSTGEVFCVLDSNSLQRVPLPVWMRGSAVTAADRNGSEASLMFGTETLRPLTPADLSAQLTPQGDLELTWMRRSRCGFAWLDEVDAPLGESREQYSVTISNGAASADFSAAEPVLVVPGADLAALGVGQAIIEVRQVGDWAVSRPAQLTVDLV